MRIPQNGQGHGRADRTQRRRSPSLTGHMGRNICSDGRFTTTLILSLSTAESLLCAWSWVGNCAYRDKETTIPLFPEFSDRLQHLSHSNDWWPLRTSPPSGSRLAESHLQYPMSKDAQRLDHISSSYVPLSWKNEELLDVPLLALMSPWQHPLALPLILGPK